MKISAGARRLKYPNQKALPEPCAMAAAFDRQKLRHGMRGAGFAPNDRVKLFGRTELPPGKELDHAGPGGGSLCVSSDGNRKGSTSKARHLRLVAVYRG